MSREKSANAFLRGLAWPIGTRFDRVENVVVDGMFDVNVCVAPIGIDIWIETKAPKTPKKTSTPLFAAGNHGVLQSQINWSITHLQAGGNGCFFISTDRWRIFVDAMHAQQLNHMTLDEVMNSSIVKIPKPSLKNQSKFLLNELLKYYL